MTAMQALQALLWILAAGLLWALYRENRRLRAELADTELANEGLTEELDNWRVESGVHRARMH